MYFTKENINKVNETFSKLVFETLDLNQISGWSKEQYRCGTVVLNQSHPESNLLTTKLIKCTRAIAEIPQKKGSFQRYWIKENLAWQYSYKGFVRDSIMSTVEYEEWWKNFHQEFENLMKVYPI